MAPKKKHKINKKVIKRKASKSKQKKSNDLILKFTKQISDILKKFILFIALVINSAVVLAKNSLIQLLNLIKKIFKLLLGIKEAFF